MWYVRPFHASKRGRTQLELNSSLVRSSLPVSHHLALFSFSATTSWRAVWTTPGTLHYPHPPRHHFAGGCLRLCGLLRRLLSQPRVHELQKVGRRVPGGHASRKVRVAERMPASMRMLCAWTGRGALMLAHIACLYSRACSCACSCACSLRMVVRVLVPMLKRVPVRQNHLHGWHAAA